MRLSLKQLGSLLLLAGVTCGVWQMGRYLSKERATAAFHLLEQSLSEQSVPAESADNGEIFKLLLGSDEGPRFLRLLDSKYDTVAFHESRNAVYYIHSRRGEADKFCIGTVVVNADEGFPMSGHAGFPHFIHLQGLQLEGDVMSIEFVTSRDDGDQGVVKLLGLVPGGLYRHQVALEQTTGRQVTYNDLALPNPHDY